MQRWRQVTAEKLRANRPRVFGGTLAADVEVYLATLADRPALQALRRVHLAWWVARFPNRSRHTLNAPELRTALAEFAVTKIQALAQPFACAPDARDRASLSHRTIQPLDRTRREGRAESPARRQTGAQ
jgi:hypothetical protein